MDSRDQVHVASSALEHETSFLMFEERELDATGEDQPPNGFSRLTKGDECVEPL